MLSLSHASPSHSRGLRLRPFVFWFPVRLRRDVVVTRIYEQITLKHKFLFQSQKTLKTKQAALDLQFLN